MSLPVPSHDEILFLMESGFIQRDAKRLQAARETFEGVRVLCPQSEMPDIALGTVSFAEGNIDEAITRYQAALTKNPSSAFAHAQMGEACLFKKDQDTARQYLEKAVELDPRGEAGNLARSLLDLAKAAKVE